MSILRRMADDRCLLFVRARVVWPQLCAHTPPAPSMPALSYLTPMSARPFFPQISSSARPKVHELEVHGDGWRRPDLRLRHDGIRPQPRLRELNQSVTFKRQVPLCVGASRLRPHLSTQKLQIEFFLFQGFYFVRWDHFVRSPLLPSYRSILPAPQLQEPSAVTLSRQL